MYLGKQAEYEDVWNNINNLEKKIDIQNSSKFISTEYNDYVLTNEQYDKFKIDNELNKNRMEDDYGEIGGYRYNENCRGWISFYAYMKLPDVKEKNNRDKLNSYKFNKKKIHRNLDFDNKNYNSFNY